MAKITLDEEFVDETTKIVALGYRHFRWQETLDVGFCLAIRVPDSARPDVWFFQLLVLETRGNPRQFLPAAARLYRRIKKRDDVAPELRFKHCAM